VTGGDPDLHRSEQVLLALERGGADIIEIGVPFSDPVADGPVIQRASERALAAGATLERVLALCSRVRSRISAPVVLFTYLNPMLRFGWSRFAAKAADAGVDGLLVVDLPLEEFTSLGDPVREAGIDPILLLSPTTTQARIRRAAAAGSGFLYAISALGVTGARAEVSDEARRLVERIRPETRLPVAVGFGISGPDQVRQVGRWADAAVVGSSIVKVIAETGDHDDLAERVENRVRWLLGRDPSGPGEQP